MPFFHASAVRRSAHLLRLLALGGLGLTSCASDSATDKNYSTDAARSFKKLWGSSGATLIARTLRAQGPQLFAADPDYSCNTSGSGTTTITCTNSQADSFTCQGTSYSWAAGGSMAATFSMASGTTYTVGLELSGTMTGGEFTDAGTSVSCSFHFSYDATGLASGEVYDVNCSTAAFSCTVGGQTLNCSDLSQAFKDTADAC